MATDVILPKQGQSVESCLIVEWKVAEGERVEEGDVLCVIETDKATFDVEAPASGTLLKTLVEEGSDVPVLTRIAVIGEPGEEVATVTAEPEPAAPATVAVEVAGRGNGTGTKDSKMQKIRISPRARRLAEARQVDISALKGTGPAGRIIVRDVEAYLARPRPVAEPVFSPPVPAVTAGEEFEEVPLKSVRKVIAERMLQSVQTSAQYTLHTTAPAGALLAYRKLLKNSPESYGLQQVTINDLVHFAVARLLPRFPDLNSHFLGDRFRRYRDVHLGFAVDTDRGLMVPVIRNASKLSLSQLAVEAARLRDRCLNGTVTTDELNGGTFTVSNLGSAGISFFTPVLNVPQVGILGVGSIELYPVERDGDVVFEKKIALSLTTNHQVVDGAPAARFLQELSGLLEHFELIAADPILGN